MKGRLFVRSVVFLSLLLCCASLLAWIRSHHRLDLIIWGGAGGEYYELVTIPGQFRVTHASGWPIPHPVHWEPEPFTPLRPVFGQQPVRSSWLPIGIGLQSGVRKIMLRDPSVSAPAMVTYQIVAVPYAVPAFVFGGLALLPLVRHSNRRQLLRTRRERGLCPACGYDLRATPGHCPECGHTAANSAEVDRINRAKRPADAA